jgi:hypothetical protein
MVYGLDYHDLAQFYREEGNREQALAVAEEGLKKGQGRKDELRQFLAGHALESGDRERYLDLQCARAVEGSAEIFSEPLKNIFQSPHAACNGLIFSISV